jgi:hypothetical protein
MAQGLTMAESARAAGISRNAVFEWRRDDPAFAAEFEQAYAEGTDVWEAEGRRRAFTESDTLFIFLMKARDPEMTANTAKARQNTRIRTRPATMKGFGRCQRRQGTQSTHSCFEAISAGNSSANRFVSRDAPSSLLTA